jgi:hypothetical protein
MLSDSDKKDILQDFTNWSGGENLKNTPFNEIDMFLHEGLDTEKHDESEVRDWVNSLYKGKVSAAVDGPKWETQTDGVLIYGDDANAKVWSEVQKHGTVFTWEVVDPKKTHMKGQEKSLKSAKKMAEDGYKKVVGTTDL